jgi:ribosomal protein L7/L12
MNPDYYFHASHASIVKAEDEFLAANHEAVMIRAAQIEKNKAVTDVAKRLAILVEGDSHKKIGAIQVLRKSFNLSIVEAKDFIDIAFAEFLSANDLPF